MTTVDPWAVTPAPQNGTPTPRPVTPPPPARSAPSSEAPEPEPLPGATWTPREESAVDLERALLGCLLIASTTEPITTALDAGIDNTTWQVARHELAWRQITRLAHDGITPDVLLVADALHGTGDARAYGGRPEEYLADCVTLAPSHWSTGHYADKVVAHAARRARLDLPRRLTDLADDPDRYDQTLTGWLTDRHLEQAAGATSSWDPVDLADLMTRMREGGITGPKPTVAMRRDGQHLLYPAAVHSISGEPASGKTWVALIALVQEVDRGHDVACVDFEDRGETFVSRLWALGLTDPQIAAHVRYIRPQEALDTGAWERLATRLTGTTLVILDGITEAMTLHGLSLMDNEDVARWLALIPRRAADLGPAVLQIDHVVKNSDDRGRYAIGGQHKLAGIDGVAYKVLVAKPLAKGHRGLARIVIDKDRHGEVGPTGSTAAELHFDATSEDGTVLAWLDEPAADRAADGTFRPTGLMEKVSRYLETHPGSSGRDITTGTGAKRDYVRIALDVLLKEGRIRTEEGPKRAVLHYVTAAYREGSDS